MMSILIGVLLTIAGLVLLAPMVNGLRGGNRPRRSDSGYFRSLPMEYSAPVNRPVRGAGTPSPSFPAAEEEMDFQIPEIEMDPRPRQLSGKPAKLPEESPFESTSPPQRIGLPTRDEEDDGGGAPRQGTLGF